MSGHGQRCAAGGCGQRGPGQPAGHRARASSAEPGAGGKGRGGCPSHCESDSGERRLGTGRVGRGQRLHLALTHRGCPCHGTAPWALHGTTGTAPRARHGTADRQLSTLGTAWHHSPPPSTATSSCSLTRAPVLPAGHRGIPDPWQPQGRQPEQLQSPVPAVAQRQGQVEPLPHPRPTANPRQVEWPQPCHIWCRCYTRAYSPPRGTGVLDQGRSGSTAGKTPTVGLGQDGEQLPAGSTEGVAGARASGWAMPSTRHAPATSPRHAPRGNGSAGAPRTEGSRPGRELRTAPGTAARGRHFGFSQGCAQLAPPETPPGNVLEPEPSAQLGRESGRARRHPERPGLPPPAHLKVPRGHAGTPRSPAGARRPRPRSQQSDGEPRHPALGRVAPCRPRLGSRRLHVAAMAGRRGGGERQESRTESPLPLRARESFPGSAEAQGPGVQRPPGR